MTHVLFLCDRNRWRSPTAEQVFAGRPEMECASAGVDRDAETPVSPELLEWADLIFVMERTHKRKLMNLLGDHLRGKKIVCLDIPDRYRFMDPSLVDLLVAKVGAFLPHIPGSS